MEKKPRTLFLSTLKVVLARRRLEYFLLARCTRQQLEFKAARLLHRESEELDYFIREHLTKLTIPPPWPYTERTQQVLERFLQAGAGYISPLIISLGWNDRTRKLITLGDYNLSELKTHIILFMPEITRNASDRQLRHQSARTLQLLRRLSVSRM